MSETAPAPSCTVKWQSSVSDNNVSNFKAGLGDAKLILTISVDLSGLTGVLYRDGTKLEKANGKVHMAWLSARHTFLERHDIEKIIHNASKEPCVVQNARI